MIHLEPRVSALTIMTYTLSPVYTADTTEAGLVLHIPKNTDPSCGAIEFTSFPESMSNKLKKIQQKLCHILKSLHFLFTGYSHVGCKLLLNFK